MRDAGIYVAANYLFGLPEETKESLEFKIILQRKLILKW